MANRFQRVSKPANPIQEVGSLPGRKEFGDAITLDHKVLNEDDESRDHDRNICVVCDRATMWIQGYCDKTKSAEATTHALERF